MAGTWDAEALGGVSSASVQELEAKNARGEGGPRSAPKAGAPTSELQRVWAREEELRKSGETINLGIGMPAADLIPKDGLLASLTRGAFESEEQDMWGYNGSQGYATLREGMAQHFSAVRGMEVTADSFLIDGGGGGAIATVAQTFLDAGDAVIAERPGYMVPAQAPRTLSGPYYPLHASD